MKRLADFIRHIWADTAPSCIDGSGDLPFSPEELARLISSGRREDMKLLAEGLMRPNPKRRSIKAA